MEAVEATSPGSLEVAEEKLGVLGMASEGAAAVLAGRMYCADIVEGVGLGTAVGVGVAEEVLVNKICLALSLAGNFASGIETHSGRAGVTGFLSSGLCSRRYHYTVFALLGCGFGFGSRFGADLSRVRFASSFAGRTSVTNRSRFHLQ